MARRYAQVVQQNIYTKSLRGGRHGMEMDLFCITIDRIVSSQKAFDRIYQRCVICDNCKEHVNIVKGGD